MNATIIPFHRPPKAAPAETYLDGIAAVLRDATRYGVSAARNVKTIQVNLNNRRDELLAVIDGLREQDMRPHPNLKHISIELEAAAMVLTELSLLARRANRPFDTGALEPAATP